VEVDRRNLLIGAAAAASLAGCGDDAPSRPQPQSGRLLSDDAWDDVRAQFALSDDTIHMSAMLIASHPATVREAIERHRRGLDADPVTYLERNNTPMQREARSAAGRYLGVDAGNIALTDSTTMGVGLVYNGLSLRPGDEVLSTTEDYYVTSEALRQLSVRTGAVVRETPLYEDARTLSSDEAAARIVGAITPRTRVVALTWVHSSTGFKIPAARIGEILAEENRRRGEDDQILFCLDGVHGFGIEDFSLSDLGCDYFMSGCHKWLFGPRGTGIIAAGRRGYAPLTPSIPSFIEDGVFEAWMWGGDPGPTTGARMTPGGFKAFEHKWAIPEAFQFQNAIGRARVAERTHELARQLKEGLAGMSHVTLHTPLEEARSAGIVSFDVNGFDPRGAMRRLRERNIIASVAPYATPHVRLTPSIRNSPAEIEAVLREVRALG